MRATAAIKRRVTGAVLPKYRSRRRSHTTQGSVSRDLNELGFLRTTQ